MTATFKARGWMLLAAVVASVAACSTGSGAADGPAPTNPPVPAVRPPSAVVAAALLRPTQIGLGWTYLQAARASHPACYAGIQDAGAVVARNGGHLLMESLIIFDSPAHAVAAIHDVPCSKGASVADSATKIVIRSVTDEAYMRQQKPTNSTGPTTSQVIIRRGRAVILLDSDVPLADLERLAKVAATQVPDSRA